MKRISVPPLLIFDGYHQLRANTNAVSESQENVLAIEGVFRSILNTETGLRGFEISGDEAFLVPCHLGYKAFAAAIQRALDLTRARPEQLAHLEKVRVLETHWRTQYVEPLIYADPDRLMQVLTNLLSDAAKFSPRNEIVTLPCRTGGTNVRIEVRDRGPGIPRDFRSRISSVPPDRRARAEQRW